MMRVEVAAYCVPTEAPESDGTAQWSKTTVVVVQLEERGERGLGYTYADAGAARIVRDVIAREIEEVSALDTRRVYQRASAAVRNHGREGLCAMAISAVDVACWDLKCRLIGVPLAKLLGMVRPDVAGYGSGGFTGETPQRLQDQLGRWADEGFCCVKMKVGRDPLRDMERVQAARNAIGRGVELMVDANGAYQRKQALAFARAFAEHGVTWFEEPVVRTDLEGLRLLRDHCAMEISGGEYCWRSHDFLELVPVLDVVQADATRCGGITGFLQAHELLDAHELPMSSHCAPALHVALGCALPRMRHVEWFFDHARIERMLFDGAPQPDHGRLAPDLSRPGIGMELKREDAERFAC
ncbi:MAG TPA: enolase C-terminal domain-like protein [Myxococcales bacterium]|nr:enolase C-terminal domain-like protein [Myxococcales bacterium]